MAAKTTSPRDQNIFFDLSQNVKKYKPPLFWRTKVKTVNVKEREKERERERERIIKRIIL